jgi:transcriptional regulator with XRE-family HTH domain
MSETGGSAETLGRTIRALRLAHRPGMTQADLADAIGGAMTQADVSNLELGKVALPRRPRLERIAAVFGVTLGELLAHSGWRRPPPSATPSWRTWRTRRRRPTRRRSVRRRRRRRTWRRRSPGGAPRRGGGRWRRWARP